MILEMMDKNEFYIGWMPAAPRGFAKHVRRAVIVLFSLVITGAVILALLQKKFNASRFEFGQPIQVKGIYQQLPVPSIKVRTQQDAFGRTSYITMPLVGYGKFGADGIIRDLEKERNVILDKREIEVKGMLIYHDGKTLLQIDKNDKPLISIHETDSRDSLLIKELGVVRLTGEILDPKCYFGVMKPGHGKPHRDCAIRCIAGGINPVFWARDANGESNYFLLLDEDGNKMNEIVKDHVAEPVSLEARLVQYNDWMILYVNKKTIKRTGGLSWFKLNDPVVACGPGQ